MSLSILFSPCGNMYTHTHIYILDPLSAPVYGFVFHLKANIPGVYIRIVTRKSYQK